jgi:hypothetical protein
MRLVPADEPCDECEALGGVLLLEAEHASGWVGGIALCLQCRIKAEALLRGSRKHGPRVGNWA